MPNRCLQASPARLLGADLPARDKRCFDAVKKEIESDPRLTLEAKRRRVLRTTNRRRCRNYISYLGTTISVIFSIGAIIGARSRCMRAVASRTAEIGTLRALGFPRMAILVGSFVEALTLGLLGASSGLSAASLCSALSISTTNSRRSRSSRSRSG